MLSNAPADLIFVNGAVYTVDAARRWARAVAVRGDAIVAVGEDADVRALAGPSTEVIDLDGRMLLPGFQDAHVHPPASGLEMRRCNLSDAYFKDEYLRIVAEYSASHPDAEWILGGGWSMDAFAGGAPTKDLLDGVVADRPVFLSSRDGHSGWANSRALDLSGITSSTPDPRDGRIERLPDGSPAGTVHEGAMYPLEDTAPAASAGEWAEGLRVAQRYLHSLGITAWQDAIVGGHYPTFETYVAMAERGELTARVVGALWWDRRRGGEQIEELLALRERGRVGRFAATSVKIMQDGIVENFTAGTLTPYRDRDGSPTGNAGLSFVEPEALKGYVARLDAEGFQVHFHALGDRAVREALDAIEAARAANGMNDLRHHLAHIQIVHPDDLSRFRTLGAVANAQPLWAMNEGQMVHLTLPFIGPERAGWQYPFASLHRAGAVLAFGSDWSVSTPDPLAEMHVAVNRTAPPTYAYLEPDDPALTDPFLPDERVDLATAIAAFTIGSAYVNHLDDITGSIEAGKRADLVVLDRNLFAHPIAEIHEAIVVLTLVAGERVHAAGDLG
jgi:predicted amidohydrolase YtcJ